MRTFVWGVTIFGLLLAGGTYAWTETQNQLPPIMEEAFALIVDEESESADLRFPDWEVPHPEPETLREEAWDWWVRRLPYRMQVASASAHIDFGRNLVGLEAASQFYYAKKPQDLTIGEKVGLVSVALDPVGCDPYINPDEFGSIVRRIETRLERAGWVLRADVPELVLRDPKSLIAGIFAVPGVERWSGAAPKQAWMDLPWEASQGEEAKLSVYRQMAKMANMPQASMQGDGVRQRVDDEGVAIVMHVPTGEMVWVVADDVRDVFRQREAENLLAPFSLAAGIEAGLSTETEWRDDGAMSRYSEREVLHRMRAFVGDRQYEEILQRFGVPDTERVNLFQLVRAWGVIARDGEWHPGSWDPQQTQQGWPNRLTTSGLYSRHHERVITDETAHEVRQLVGAVWAQEQTAVAISPDWAVGVLHPSTRTAEETSLSIVEWLYEGGGMRDFAPVAATDRPRVEVFEAGVIELGERTNDTQPRRFVAPYAFDEL